MGGTQAISNRCSAARNLARACEIDGAGNSFHLRQMNFKTALP